MSISTAIVIALTGTRCARVLRGTRYALSLLVVLFHSDRIGFQTPEIARQTRRLKQQCLPSLTELEQANPELEYQE